MPRKKLTDRARLSMEMRSEVVLLFRVAETLKGKRGLVKKWNAFHSAYKISLSSVYRWDRILRMSIKTPMGSCEIKKNAALNRHGYQPSQYN
jgi:hypothetical protein